MTSFFTELHILHLRNKNEEELNKLLGMVVDLENMYIAMSREENMETKRVYGYLFKVLTPYIYSTAITQKLLQIPRN